MQLVELRVYPLKLRNILRWSLICGDGVEYAQFDRHVLVNRARGH